MNIFLFLTIAAASLLLFLLLVKMKKSSQKEEQVWVMSFLAVSVLFSYCIILLVFFLLSAMAVVETISFGLFAGLVLLVVGITVPLAYYLIEHMKYTEKYEKIAKAMAPATLEQGFTYIVEEPKTEKSMKLFAELLAKGGSGLCVTRTNPKELTEEHKEFAQVKIYWLTEMQGEGNLRPTDLEELSYHITNFISAVQNPVVYLDGFEYLVNYNSFTKILHLFQVLKDTISVKKAIMIMPINSGTFEQQNLKMVELEFKVV